MAIPPWPAAGRPRERLAAHGAHHLSDAELVALVLRTGVAGRNAVEVASGLLSRFGRVAGLLGASVQEVAGFPGVGPARAALLGFLWATLANAKVLGNGWVGLVLLFWFAGLGVGRLCNELRP